MVGHIVGTGYTLEDLRNYLLKSVRRERAERDEMNWRRVEGVPLSPFMSCWGLTNSSGVY
jgi:hypothetical protein